MTPERECRTEKAYTVILLFYLRASSSWASFSSSIRKREGKCSDSIRSKGFGRASSERAKASRIGTGVVPCTLVLSFAFPGSLSSS